MKEKLMAVKRGCWPKPSRGLVLSLRRADGQNLAALNSGVRTYATRAGSQLVSAMLQEPAAQWKCIFRRLTISKQEFYFCNALTYSA